MTSLRSILYFLARLLGDAQAISRGPGAILKRVMRKALGRGMGGIINRTIK